MVEEEAEAGSMMDSVILVIVRSLFTGRKFLTPEMRFSRLAPKAPSFRRSVRRLPRELKPRKISLLADCCAG